MYRIASESREKVLILETHTKPGGTAHALNIDGYKFESGHSLLSAIDS